MCSLASPQASSKHPLADRIARLRELLAAWGDLKALNHTTEISPARKSLWTDLAAKVHHELQLLRNYAHAFPKELRKHPTMRDLLARIHHLENEWLHTWQNTHHNLEIRSSLETMKNALEGTMSKRDQILRLLDEWQHSPLIHKFMRGEPILGTKSSIQWGRKLAHVFCGLGTYTLFMHSGLPESLILWILGTFITSCLSLEIARHLHAGVNKWVCRYFKPIMREEETTRVNSAMYYMIALATLYFVCPLQVTMLALLYLTLVDTMAGIIGVTWGRHKMTAKASWEGFLAGWFTGSVTTLFFLGVELNASFSATNVLASLSLGGIAALSEIIFPQIDDNLTIPVISTPFIALAFWLLGLI